MDDSRLLEIPGLLADAGCRKITFEGGEPLLYPRIFDLVDVAKEVGLTTCLVTNGSLLTSAKLERLSETLDWLGLSVDSAREEVEVALGRGYGNHVSHTTRVANWAHDLGVALKVNSVITKLNYRENMTEFIGSLGPRRFKAFQMLAIRGENEIAVDGLGIGPSEFRHFVEAHRSLDAYGIRFVPETQEDMIGSYIMMQPDGTFYSNLGHRYTYGQRSIFEGGVQSALKDAGWDSRKFLRRGGCYPWVLEKGSLPRGESMGDGGETPSGPSHGVRGGDRLGL